MKKKLVEDVDKYLSSSEYSIETSSFEKKLAAVVSAVNLSIRKRPTNTKGEKRRDILRKETLEMKGVSRHSQNESTSFQTDINRDNLICSSSSQIDFLPSSDSIKIFSDLEEEKCSGDALQKTDPLLMAYVYEQELTIFD